MAYTVSGRVIDADGQPVRERQPCGLAARVTADSRPSHVRSKHDGTFISGPLAPGQCTCSTRRRQHSDVRARTSRSGYAPVTIRRRGRVRHRRCTLHRSTQVAGRMKFESERDVEALHPDCHRARRARGRADAREPCDRGGCCGRRDVHASQMLHGPRLMRADAERGSSPSPWWLKAVLLDGVNVTNVPIDFSSETRRRGWRSSSVIGRRPSSVSCTTKRDCRSKARVCSLFSKDASMWAAWSTAVQAGVSDENGRFWFVDAMPAGDYRAIALREDAPPSIAEAVDELPRLDKFATPIVGRREQGRADRADHQQGAIDQPLRYCGAWADGGPAQLGSPR